MPTSTLFVGNIPYSTSEQDLRDLFGRAGGKVASVRVITDLDTGRSKGYAFIEMASAEDAQKAIEELNSFNLNGRSIVVNEARPRQGGGGRGGELGRR
jgi:RNA recognition motif-containing protein